VLALLASGLSNTEIAERLYLSNATVKTHINRIFAKTGARDRAQAVRYAYQHRLAAG
jgi:DNA-binding NarL/FixJ family response regulator